jgi:hypothetical protein
VSSCDVVVDDDDAKDESSLLSLLLRMQSNPTSSSRKKKKKKKKEGRRRQNNLPENLAAPQVVIQKVTVCRCSGLDAHVKIRRRQVDGGVELGCRRRRGHCNAFVRIHA